MSGCGPTLPSPASDWNGSYRRMSCRTRQLSTTAESDPGCVKTLTLVGKVEFASQFQSNTKRAALAPSVMRSRQRKQFSINFVQALRTSIGGIRTKLVARLSRRAQGYAVAVGTGGLTRIVGSKQNCGCQADLFTTLKCVDRLRRRLLTGDGLSLIEERDRMGSMGHPVRRRSEKPSRMAASGLPIGSRLVPASHGCRQMQDRKRPVRHCARTRE